MVFIPDKCILLSHWS